MSDGIDIANGNSNDGYDEFTNTHSDGSKEEETTTTHTVDEMDAEDYRYETDYISDDSEKKKMFGVRQ